MEKLSDEELSMATTMHDRMSAANVNAYVDPAAMLAAERLQRAATELQQLRAAKAADRERVRGMVREAMAFSWGRGRGLNDLTSEDCDAIATRVADALAVPERVGGYQLTEADIEILGWLYEDAPPIHRGDLVRRLVVRLAQVGSVLPPERKVLEELTETCGEAADAFAVPGRQSLSDTDRRTLEWLRGVMAYTADGDSGGMAARANATIDRLLSDRSAPPRPSLSDTDRRHLVALRSFIAGIDGQRGHGNDWSAELALLDRLLESP